MKFTIDRKALIEIIQPAMEVAGRKLGRYNIEKYSGITHQTLSDYTRTVKKAINSSISEVCQNEKYTILATVKNRIQKHVHSQIIEDYGKLRRITFGARNDKITVSASNGNIMFVSEISGEGLTSLGYKCEKEGVLTVEFSKMKMSRSLPMRKK